MNNIYNGENFTLNYDNQNTDMKARIINKKLSDVARDCTTINELLDKYENDVLPEYVDVIRSAQHLFTTHLPLCMLYHLLYDEKLLYNISYDEFDEVKEFLFVLCENVYALKGESL